jgi:hypothetical protein
MSNLYSYHVLLWQTEQPLDLIIIANNETGLICAICSVLLWSTIDSFRTTVPTPMSSVQVLVSLRSLASLQYQEGTIAR